jgi:hypothetical protein
MLLVRLALIINEILRIYNTDRILAAAWGICGESLQKCDSLTAIRLPATTSPTDPRKADGIGIQSVEEDMHRCLDAMKRAQANQGKTPLNKESPPNDHRFFEYFADIAILA